jgi:hypothetical protein
MTVVDPTERANRVREADKVGEYFRLDFGRPSCRWLPRCGALDPAIGCVRTCERLPPTRLGGGMSIQDLLGLLSSPLVRVRKFRPHATFADTVACCELGGIMLAV